MRARLPAGATVALITWPEASAFAETVRAQLRETAAAEPDQRARCSFEASYLSDVRRRSTGNPGFYEYLGADAWGVFDPFGSMVGIHVARPSTGKRKNAWGRYVNHYLAYVRPESRAQGYGAGAEAVLQARWAHGGWDRVKTLCQSRLGVYYHEALADVVWGVNPKGELVIDSPLDPAATWPAGMPIKARNAAVSPRDTPLTAQEVWAVVTDFNGRFRMGAAEAYALLARRAEGAGVGPAGAPVTVPHRPGGEPAALPHGDPPEGPR